MADPWAVQKVEPADPWAVASVQPSQASPPPAKTKKAAGPQTEKHSLLDDALSGLVEPWAKAGRDIADNYDRVTARGRAGPPRTMSGALKQTVDDLTAGPRLVGDAVGLLASPVEAVVRPVARMMNRAPVRPYEAPRPVIEGGRISMTKPRALEGEEAQSVIEGAINTALSAARPSSLEPVRMLPRQQAPARLRPEQVAPAKQAAYAKVDQLGVRYGPDAFDGLVDGMVQDTAAANLNPMRHPKAASMVADIEKMRGSSPTLTELDQLRQVIRRDVASASDPAEQFFGRKMIGKIDEFINSADPSHVAAGDPAEAAEAIRRARDLNTRLHKVEDVQDAVESARLRAGSTGSGGNVDNATRQNLRRVLEGATNLTAEEKSALESIVLGGKGQNFLRLVGKLSPSGNGLMAAGNLTAAALGGPLGAIPGAAGLAAKAAADGMTMRKVQQLIDLMASGGEAAATPPAASRLMSRLPAHPRAYVGAGVTTRPLRELPAIEGTALPTPGRVMSGR